MLLDATRSQFLVIDVQDRLLPSLEDAERMVKHCVCLVRAAHLLDVPASYVEQNPNGLGPSASEIISVFGDQAAFEKDHFSAFSDPQVSHHIMALKSEGRDQLILSGCESHVCVLQTALEAKAAGLQVYVAWLATASRSSENRQLAKDRLQAAGCELLSTEEILFEWLRDYKHTAFRAVQALVKEL
ncbi:MAG: isochorismatase family protein [Henriciella sp.]|nr:isochorismatase family protein [Henriciella sp.]